ncbi:MAG: hypothetical protein ACOVLB_00330, partial [Candidatus Nanopelagicus sp.]
MATNITDLQNDLKASEAALEASKQALAATKPALVAASKQVAAIDAEIKKLSSTVGGVFTVGTPQYENYQQLNRKRDQLFDTVVRPAENAENDKLQAVIDAVAKVDTAKDAVKTGAPATLKAPLPAAPVVTSDPKVDAQDKKNQDPVAPAVADVSVTQEPAATQAFPLTSQDPATAIVTAEIGAPTPESSTFITNTNNSVLTAIDGRPLGLAGLPINQPEVPQSGLIAPVVTETQINASNTSQDPNPETTFGNLGSTQSQAVARQQAQVVAQRDWRLKIS